MPRLNGIQAVQKIKTFINSKNAMTETKIAEPKFVFLTAYKTSAFDKHIKELNIEQVFEKPLSLN
jgi:CheY-like chemotaxis protein